METQNIQFEGNRAEIEGICLYANIARSQRATEIARGDGLEGTRSYEQTGCFDCDGKTKVCLGLGER